MGIGRNDLCICGSGKKYKKCCLNWSENWAIGIDNFECEQQVKDIVKGAFDFIAEHNYQGGCHLISAIVHILLTEKGFNSVVRIGEVQIDNYLFDHSWIELDGEVIDIAIMNQLNDIKLPPVLFGKSVATGKKIDYQYGVTQYLDPMAQVIMSKSIGQYIMEGKAQSTLKIMQTIAENSGIFLDDIGAAVSKYYSSYRKMSISESI
ncbi:YecA family protein [Virgibacillus kekensis]|uniref:YecA family protein n=1 Tax=Virgibacillus kekensis TaxID=202261 RepID=A0ABV9DM09_9BACI